MLASFSVQVLLKIRGKICQALSKSGAPISKVSGDEFNSTAVYLDRTVIFKGVIQMVMTQKERYGFKNKKDKTVLLCNESLLKDIEPVNIEDISLDFLRSFLIQEHIACLLHSQRYVPFIFIIFYAPRHIKIALSFCPFVHLSVCVSEFFVSGT